MIFKVKVLRISIHKYRTAEVSEINLELISFLKLIMCLRLRNQMNIRSCSILF